MLQGFGEIENLIYWSWKCKNVTAAVETAWRFLKKLNLELPCMHMTHAYDPVIQLLGVYQRELKIYIQTKLVHGCS